MTSPQDHWRWRSSTSARLDAEHPGPEHQQYRPTSRRRTREQVINADLESHRGEHGGKVPKLETLEGYGHRPDQPSAGRFENEVNFTSCQEHLQRLSSVTERSHAERPGPKHHQYHLSPRRRTREQAFNTDSESDDCEHSGKVPKLETLEGDGHRLDQPSAGPFENDVRVTSRQERLQWLLLATERSHAKRSGPQHHQYRPSPRRRTREQAINTDSESHGGEHGGKAPKLETLEGDERRPDQPSAGPFENEVNFTSRQKRLQELSLASERSHAERPVLEHLHYHPSPRHRTREQAINTDSESHGDEHGGKVPKLETLEGDECQPDQPSAGRLENEVNFTSRLERLQGLLLVTERSHAERPGQQHLQYHPSPRRRTREQAMNTDSESHGGMHGGKVPKLKTLEDYGHRPDQPSAGRFENQVKFTSRPERLQGLLLVTERSHAERPGQQHLQYHPSPRRRTREQAMNTDSESHGGMHGGKVPKLETLEDCGHRPDQPSAGRFENEVNFTSRLGRLQKLLLVTERSHAERPGKQHQQYHPSSRRRTREQVISTDSESHGGEHGGKVPKLETLEGDERRPAQPSAGQFENEVNFASRLERLQRLLLLTERSHAECPGQQHQQYHPSPRRRTREQVMDTDSESHDSEHGRKVQQLQSLEGKGRRPDQSPAGRLEEEFNITSAMAILALLFLLLHLISNLAPRIST
ncbi:uncharacterized protein LOC142777443 [Rhipicephalus microplus]|uniref:uncharacterized protein LOC142777443 n=1 Tax=Rhipicephalus microplus TaxID=6941 RepID=UPI003F6B55C8